MNDMTLHDLNTADSGKQYEILLTCCGARKWAKCLVNKLPAEDLVDLEESAEECWLACNTEDRMEAFAAHPEIGNLESLEKKYRHTAGWAAEEQSGAGSASSQTLEALAEANRLYREKFGYIFIVCATGKSAEEMLGLLHTRLHNDPREEIDIAADEQWRITKLRLEKLLE
jgi:2-oxo-4-hydroxy-4-carboxy-5-ureidoimidazoline decarboxylase